MIKVRQNLRKVATIALCLAGSATMFAQNTATEDEGVVINGVKWATRNLDVGGTFVENPEDYGALFQWGRKADGHESRTSAITNVVSTTDTPNHDNFIIAGSVSGSDWRSPHNNALWNVGTETAPVKAANDPSPSGWRVPTDTEMRKLLDKSKVDIMSDKGGYVFTDKATGASLFLPAAGNRFCSSGNLSNRGEYWSSSSYGSSESYYVYFAVTGPLMNSQGSRADGRSVRPVAESGNVGINTISGDTENAIVIGYFDILGRKLPEEPKQGFYIIRYSNGTSEKVVK